MSEFIVKSTQELLSTVKVITSKWYPNKQSKQELWFRGVSDETYQLLPNIHRPENEFLLPQEESLLEEFKCHSIPLIQSRPIDDWEWYFTAQHFGLPTRLMDWTENLLTALYFSIRKYRNDRKLLNKPNRNNAAIWVIDPGKLNSISVNEDYDCAVFASMEGVAGQWLPKNINCATPGGCEVNGFLIQNELPICIYPPKTTPRITAQHGMFMIWGRNNKTLTDIAAENSVFLEKITIDLDNFAELDDQMDLFGLNDFAIFPELAYCHKKVLDRYRNANAVK